MTLCLPSLKTPNLRKQLGWTSLRCGSHSAAGGWKPCGTGEGISPKETSLGKQKTTTDRHSHSHGTKTPKPLALSLEELPGKQNRLKSQWQHGIHSRDPNIFRLSWDSRPGLDRDLQAASQGAPPTHKTLRGFMRHNIEMPNDQASEFSTLTEKWVAPTASY